MIVMALVAAVAAGPEPGLAWWPADRRSRQIEIERVLLEVPLPQSLRGWHTRFGSEPHVAGTPGDLRNIERLAAAFAGLGLDVERHEFFAWLPRPVTATLEIASPVTMDLPLAEPPLAEDPDSGHPELAIGWNAYSGNGDVTAPVVYANYGTREDFETLRDLGVDLAGRIVIARYGGNFRGYKAKFAEAAGAAGLIIYTDPQDSGWGKGIPYPEGGWANGGSIQRGSIKALPYPGDPLTPGTEARRDAPRLDPDDLALPRIPVQPIGWDAAAQILSRMTGPAVPPGWQGGLPFAYRVTGGDELRVRLAVEQECALRRSANVIATLPGTAEPRKLIVIGCHHDAWGFGAADPLAGTIVLYECARSFAELARRGFTLRRTLVFAAWGAEEHGIIGSVEWCEANRAVLSQNAVAYINLDMAAMGPKFDAGSAPALKELITSAAGSVEAADGEGNVLDQWHGEGPDDPPVLGSLGGGSDHVGFYCHLGVTSCGLGSRGSSGTSYHSNYDTLTWYRGVVGDDYAPALMLTRMTNLIAARLAEAPLLPLDPARYPQDLRGHLDDLRGRARTLGVALDTAELDAAVDRLDRTAAAMRQGLLAAVAAGRLDEASLAEINSRLLGIERAWIHEPGLPGRPWFRNLYAATDPDSGYAAWMLPALRYHVERRDPAGAAEAVSLYAGVLETLDGACEAIGAVAEGGSTR